LQSEEKNADEQMYLRTPSEISDYPLHKAIKTDKALTSPSIIKQDNY
jgi:hypothetical protein